MKRVKSFEGHFEDMKLESKLHRKGKKKKEKARYFQRRKSI